MSSGIPKEVQALGQVLAALQGLEESQQRWVISASLSNLGLAAGEIPPPLGSRTPPRQPPGLPGTQQQASGATGTPKEFLRAKNPQTDTQRIACLAYFLTHQRGQPHFKTRDLTSLNTEAAGIRLSNPSFAVGNATKQGHYLAPAGGGKKQITSIGEEVVNALPDQDAVRAVGQSRPRRKAGKRRVDKKKG